MRIPQWKKNFDEKKIISNIKLAIGKKSFSEGKFTKKFETKISKFLNIKYVVAVPSGTASLLISLLAINLNKNDEVIIQNRGWISAYNAANLLGLKVKFVDVEKNRPVINIKDLKRVVTKKTRAIILIHMGGRICNMKELLIFAKKRKIKIIEDAAQAFGSKYNNQFAGTFAEIGCFSMSIAKTISSGQGGFIVTNKKKIYNNLIKLKNNGLNNIKEIYKWGDGGLNFKFSDILAAIALTDLDKFQDYKKKQIKNYLLYLKKLEYLNELKIIPVNISEGEIPQYVEILSSRRNSLYNYMKKNLVDCRIFYPNLSKAHLNKSIKKNVYKNSDNFENHGLYLPSGPDLDLKSIKKVTTYIEKFFKK